MQITQVNPKTVKAYKHNNKKHPPDQIEKIKASIKNFGFNTPIILDKEGNIIAGHGRVTAAIELGLETVPAVYKHDLTEEQIKLYRIMDNKSAVSEWDLDNLKHEFADFQASEFTDISLSGFDEGEVIDILGQEKDLETDRDSVDMDEGEGKASEFKSYRIVKLNKHKVICHNPPDCEFCAKLKVEYGDGN